MENLLVLGVPILKHIRAIYKQYEYITVSMNLSGKTLSCPSQVRPKQVDGEMSNKRKKL